MKKFIRKMPLDVFIDRMNSLCKPFTVAAFFYSNNKDIGCTEIECNSIDTRGLLIMFKGNHGLVHINEHCDFVEWNEDGTMMCYVLECNDAIVCIYTPDEQPLKEI